MISAFLHDSIWPNQWIKSQSPLKIFHHFVWNLSNGFCNGIRKLNGKWQILSKRQPLPTLSTMINIDLFFVLLSYTQTTVLSSLLFHCNINDGSPSLMANNRDVEWCFVFLVSFIVRPFLISFVFFSLYCRRRHSKYIMMSFPFNSRFEIILIEMPLKMDFCEWIHS